MFNWLKKHNRQGLETPDPTPIEVTLRDRPLNIHEQIARFTRDDKVQQSLRNQGIDTFDEADDFEIPDAEEYRSPYEEIEMIDEMPVEHLQTRLDEQKAGVAGDIPLDRLNRAQERLKPKPKVEPKAEFQAAGAAAKAAE